MNVAEAVQLCPHLASPLALAHADTAGRYYTVPHLSRISREFMRVVMSGGGQRAMLNTPPQHAKSTTTSHYGTAWALLLNPELRFVLVGYSDEFAAGWGSKVRDVIERWGAPHGIRLRQDSKRKNEWQIDGHEGGMVCRGPSGGITGRPISVLLIDDLIKDHEQALSPTIMESHWNWWQTSVFGRLRNVTSVFMIGTRWARRDLFGRLLDQAKRTGEKWDVFKFKAIAEENDLLGRKPGEALWPEQVSLRNLEIAKQEYGPWFRTIFQQEPLDEGAGHFRPRPVGTEWPGWPRYSELGDSYVVHHGSSRTIYRKAELTILVAIDIATSEKKKSDFTSFIAAGLTQDGRTLILEVINKRLRLEQIGPELDTFCQRWRPHAVAGDDDNLSSAMLLDYRHYRNIPEVRCLPIAGRAKIVRAQPAIISGENLRVYLPQQAAWLDPYCDQLESFTGVQEEHDDMADCTGIIARLVNQIRLVPNQRRDTPFIFGSKAI